MSLQTQTQIQEIQIPFPCNIKVDEENEHIFLFFEFKLKDVEFINTPFIRHLLYKSKIADLGEITTDFYHNKGLENDSCIIVSIPKVKEVIE